MEHQPYESWIIDGVPLTETQAVELRQHVQTCDHCRRLQLGWTAVIGRIHAAVPASPSAGFVMRWQESLEERRILKQKLLTRRLLLFLVTGTVILFFSMIAYLVATTSPLELVVGTFQTVTQFLVRWDNLQQTLVSLTASVPPILPIALWILLASDVALLALVWVVSLWRISSQGVYQK